jgi:hypothetical protein
MPNGPGGLDDGDGPDVESADESAEPTGPEESIEDIYDQAVEADIPWELTPGGELAEPGENADGQEPLIRTIFDGE